MKVYSHLFMHQGLKIGSKDEPYYRVTRSLEVLTLDRAGCTFNGRRVRDFGAIHSAGYH